MTRPTPIMKAGRTRRAITGDNMDPTTNPTANGIDHSPAFIGERPSTSCRYWAMKTYGPNTAKVASMYVARDALNAGARNSRRSIKGSASLRCLRTNTAASANPAPMESAGNHPTPCAAICLRP